MAPIHSPPTARSRVMRRQAMISRAAMQAETALIISNVMGWLSLRQYLSLRCPKGMPPIGRTMYPARRMAKDVAVPMARRESLGVGSPRWRGREGRMEGGGV